MKISLTIEVDIADPDIDWGQPALTYTEDGSGRPLIDICGSEIILSYQGHDVVDFDFDVAADYLIEQRRDEEAA
jgi:hypothetical protein